MRNLVRALTVAAAAIASAVVYSRLPDRVPLHWNLSGEVDRYGSRLEAVILMPLIMIAMLALFRVLPRIDPHRANYAKFAGTYDLMVDMVLGLLLVIHVAILLGASTVSWPVELYVRAASGVVFIVLGNILPRTRQNWFFGVRTPWTLASPRVWERTHRFAGYLFVALGVIVLVTLPMAPRLGMPVLIAGAVVVAIWSLGYSYHEWRKEQGGAGMP